MLERLGFVRERLRICVVLDQWERNLVASYRDEGMAVATMVSGNEFWTQLKLCTYVFYALLREMDGEKT